MGDLTFKLSRKLCTIHCAFLQYVFGFVYELSEGLKFTIWKYISS